MKHTFESAMIRLEEISEILAENNSYCGKNCTTDYRNRDRSMDGFTNTGVISGADRLSDSDTTADRHTDKKVDKKIDE